MNFKDNKAIYLQIVDKICDDIIAGVYTADSRIPSVREYAASVEVNANTVMRSYEHLQSRELIYNKRGIGFFIAPGAREIILRSRLDSFINDDMQQIFRQLHLIGITPERLSQLYTDFLKSHKDQ